MLYKSHFYYTNLIFITQISFFYYFLLYFWSKNISVQGLKNWYKIYTDIQMKQLFRLRFIFLIYPQLIEGVLHGDRREVANPIGHFVIYQGGV